MGVSWRQYQDQPNAYTKGLFNAVLNDSYFHSVRDNYTEQILKSIGITNILNTACLTMWDLDEMHCSGILKVKAENVVTTLTLYKTGNMIRK